jgi:hypothetical protein
METEFHCPNCGTPTPAGTKAVDLEWKVARCASCKQLFDITFQLEANSDQPALSEGKTTSDYRGAVTVTESEGIFLLVHRWAHPANIAHLIIGTLFIGLPAVLSLKGGWEIMVSFAPLWCLGSFIVYQALAGLLNSTRIEIANGRLKTEHGPLPWPGRRNLPCADIKQFFVNVKASQKHGERYSLWAVLSDGRKIAVLPERLASEDLSFVERALESHLAIVDTPVS